MDVTLKRLLAVIEDGGADLVSIDIFDTLLWRTLPYPTDAFHLVGRHLRQLRMLDPEVTPDLFWRLRQLAEVRAREHREGRGEGPEVTLAEIYDELPRHLFQRFSRQEFAEEEVRVERRILRPNLDLIQVLERAVDRGLPIVGVSDTYFSEAHLRLMVDRRELSEVKIANIYTSSDHRVNKGSGLYGIMAKEWDVPPSRMVHIGDHPESDVVAPRAAGLQALHMPRVTGDLGVVAQEELKSIEARAGTHLWALHDREGDFGLTWLRGRGASSTAFAKQPVSLQPFWRYGYDYFGPVMTLFAEWVCQEALERDLRVVHGIMREGAFLSELVNRAARHHGIPLDGQTIWLSRGVVTRASIHEATVDELRPLVVRRGPLTLADLCAIVGLEPVQLEGLGVAPQRRLDEPGFIDEVLERIAETPKLRTQVLLTSRRLRERLLEYVASQAVAGRLLVMDLGWNLTIQWGLQQLLFRAGDPIELDGLYLVTTTGAEMRLLDGCRASSYLAHCGLPDQFVRRFLRSPEILEQVCLTPSGSCIGYDENLDPVLDEQRIRPLQITQCEAVREGIREFQRQWCRYRERRTTEKIRHPGLVQMARAMLERSVIAPTSEEALTFSGWEHDSNFGSGDVERLFEEKSELVMQYGDPVTVSKMGMNEIYWPSGAAALFNPAMARALAALDEGTVPAEVFSHPAATGNVEVFWDTGGGFVNGQRLGIPARVGPAGLLMAQGSFSGNRIVGLRFDLANCPAVIRLDHLWVEVLSRDRTGATQIMLRTPAEMGELLPMGCTSPEPGVFVSMGSDPQLILRLNDRDLGDVYRVRFGVFFAALAVPGKGQGPAKGRIARMLDGLGG